MKMTENRVSHALARRAVYLSPSSRRACTQASSKRTSNSDRLAANISLINIIIGAAHVKRESGI